MKLHLNSPFARNSRSQRELGQQLTERAQECNKLRKALHTLNESSLIYKKNAEEALEMAKQEISSLQQQLGKATEVKVEVNKLRGQLVQCKKENKREKSEHRQMIEDLSATIIAIRQENQEAQEKIHQQRVKHQELSRSSNHQIAEFRDNIRTLKRKNVHLEHNYNHIKEQLENERTHSNQLHNIVKRLEGMIQQLPQNNTNVETGADASFTSRIALKEEKYKKMVSLLQKEKETLRQELDSCVAQLAEVKVQNAEKMEIIKKSHQETEHKLLSHITTLRTSVTKLEGNMKLEDVSSLDGNKQMNVAAQPVNTGT